MGRNDAIVIEQNINAPEINKIIENITIISFTVLTIVWGFAIFSGCPGRMVC